MFAGLSILQRPTGQYDLCLCRGMKGNKTSWAARKTIKHFPWSALLFAIRIAPEWNRLSNLNHDLKIASNISFLLSMHSLSCCKHPGYPYTYTCTAGHVCAYIWVYMHTYIYTHTDTHTCTYMDTEL